MSSSAAQAKAALSLLDEHVRSAMVASVNRTVDAVAGKAEAYAPKETGELARSFEVEHAGPTGPIEASVEVRDADEPGQAAAVEFGTARQAPRPYFRPACNRAIPSAIADMDRSLREITRP